MKNIGSADKIIRLIIGVVIGAAGIYFQNWWGLVGLVPIFTVLINWCPMYLPLGIKTCKTKE